MRKLWFSPAAHLIKILSLTVAIVATHLLAHDTFGLMYTELMRKSARLSCQTFRYERVRDGRTILLMQGGISILTNLSTLNKAPFDLHRLPTFQGVINRHLGLVREINAYHEREKEILLNQFRDRDGAYVSFPLGVLDVQITEFAQITREQYQVLLDAHLDQFAEVSLRILPQAMSYDPDKPPTQISTEGNDDLSRHLEDSLGKLKAVAAPMVLGSVFLQAQLAIQRNSGTLHSNLLLRIGASLAVDATTIHEANTSRLKEGARNDYLTIIRQFLTYFLSGQSGRTDAVTISAFAGYSVKRQDLDTILNELSKILANQFHEIAGIEAASFWLLGQFHWWEIISWVWFGVLARNVLDFSQIAVGVVAGGRF